MQDPNKTNRGPRVFILLALALFLLHAAILLATPSYSATPLLSNLIQLASGLLATSACWFASRPARDFGKHFWVLVSGGFLLWSLAQAIATYYDSILHVSLQQPWPSDIVFFLSMAPLLMTLFIDSDAGFEWKQWPRILDLVQTIIFTLAIYLFTFGSPSAWQQGQGVLARFA